MSDKTQWGLSLYADGYMTLCVLSISDPNVNFPSASCVPYATDLRDKHWPTTVQAYGQKIRVSY